MLINKSSINELCKHVRRFRFSSSEENEIIRVATSALIGTSIPSGPLQSYRDALSNQADIIDATNAETFGYQYQLRSFLAKFPFPGSESKCVAAATSKFNQGEDQCHETNQTLQRNRHEAHNKIRARIRSVLGPCDATSKIACLRLGSHGPGKTAHSARDTVETTAYFKYSDNIQCTYSALPYVKYCLSSNPSWLINRYQEILGLTRMGPQSRFFRYHDRKAVERRVFSEIEVVASNEITFVPKNADTHRTIAMEPSGNVYLQKGVGEFIKRRLLRVGIDLRCQKTNQDLAREGSISNSLATLDLANASDTLSYETVRQLLPRDWFLFLSELRCYTGRFAKGPRKGEEVTYNKFSSMGNGFTFELESLIFWAIISECDPACSVYGDDLVLQSSGADYAIELLTHYGFKTNADKSFIDGPFRESCGSDFYLGTPVRPLFLRRRIRTIRDLWFLLNRIAWSLGQHGTARLIHVYKSLFKLLPKDLVIPGPFRFQVIMIDGHTEDYSDWETGIKLPLHIAMKYKNFVARTGSTYTYLSFTQKGKTLPVTNTVASYCYYLYGGKGGRPALRGVTINRVRKLQSPDWGGVVTSTHRVLFGEFC